MIQCVVPEPLRSIVGYDRKCATCCVPWEWAAGQVFTVLAVNVHHHHPVSNLLQSVTSFMMLYGV